MPNRPLCLPLLAWVLSACSSAPSADEPGTTGVHDTTGTPAPGSTGPEPTTAAMAGETTTEYATSTSTGPAATSTGAVDASSGDESCSGEGCGSLPCPKEGGVYCGGNGVGGDPTVLYVCQGGGLQVLEDCGEMCIYKPLGTPDVCPGDIEVPVSLMDLLATKPYVEQDCVPTEYAGWPYEALYCTYTVQGVEAAVTVADPPAERVGRWIVDAAAYIPALEALKGVDAAAYEQGLKAIGLHMLYQSSRIFPLTGDIVEDLGNGPELFPFNDGVSDPCGSGCYCRINSLHRTEWCQYVESLVGTAYGDCIAEVGDSGHTAAWAGRCLDNHIAAWDSDANDHFRARAYIANQAVSTACPPDACSSAEVVSAVKQAYGL